MTLPSSEARRNGLATKLGVTGTAGLVITAIADAIVNGHIDPDATRAATGAVTLAAVTMAGKYAQAVAQIVSDALARKLGGDAGEPS